MNTDKHRCEAFEKEPLVKSSFRGTIAPALQSHPIRSLPLRILSYLCLSAFICGSISCDSGLKTSDSDIKQVTYVDLVKLLDQSKAPKKEGVLAFLDSNKKSGPVFLLDARTPARFAKGHLPNAVNIPLPKIIEGLPELGGAKNIVVYGTTWTDPISPAAAKRLMALGYANVMDFRGGVEDWKQQGGRIETSEPAAASDAGAPAAGSVLGTPGNAPGSAPGIAPSKP